MSIRYTLRHNIKDSDVSAENEKFINNQDPTKTEIPYDFDLLRKHELAETTSGIIVYRKENGQIVPIGSGSNLQSVTVKSRNTQQTVTAESGYDGIDVVTVEPINLQNKPVTPSSTSQLVVRADNGYDGLGEVTIAAGGGNKVNLFFDDIVNLPSYTLATDNIYHSNSIVECSFPLLETVDCTNTYPALLGMNNLETVHFSKFVSLSNYRYSSPFPDTLKTIYVPNSLLSQFQADTNWADLLVLRQDISLIGE